MTENNRQRILQVGRKTGRALFGVSGVSGFTDDLQAQWSQAIQDFQNQRAALDSAESALYDVYPTITEQEDLDEWQRCFNKVNAAKSSMDAVASVVQSASDMWSSFTGLFGLGGVGSKMRRKGMVNAMAGGMGALPFALPIGLGSIIALTAAAYAAVQLVNAFTNYINIKYSDRNQRYQQKIDAGEAPEQAAKEADDESSSYAEKTSGYTVGGRIEKIAILGLIGLGIFAFSPMMKRK